MLTRILLAVCASALLVAQQPGSITGQVTDVSGAVIPGIVVTLESGGATRTATTNEVGTYTFADLPAGSYKIRIAPTGFAPLEQTLTVSAGQAVRADAALQVTLETQEVTVEGESNTTVSTEPTNNAGAVVLREEDLETLSDDPDELAQDLAALAGPAAGPNGGQIFVDGFSGAQLPPKAAIREVRINQNPFSAEYDRLGYGRIEVLTKPGADKFRGQFLYGISDRELNSRNPFVPVQGDFRSQLFDATLSGPINRRTSFSLSADRRQIDDVGIVNATVLNPDLSQGVLQQAILTPNRRTQISPRLDYALSDKHTLVGRYEYARITNLNSGVGEFTLPTRGVNSRVNQHTLQLTETSILSPSAINETRLQYIRRDNARNSLVDEPAINVLESFQGGGAPVGAASVLNSRWELQNITSLTRGRHAVKIGGRFRTSDVRDISPSNFLGTWTFAGGPGWGDTGFQTSLERYRRTLELQQLGYAPQQIRELGGGPTQFSIAGGNPLATVRQYDFAIFAQDDWRARQNLTLSYGLRYEVQNNISDWTNFAPRIGFAYAPFAGSSGQSKTVFRGGIGFFYDRVEDDLTLETLRFNGVNQRRYIVQNPDFFPNIPSVEQLAGSLVPQTVRRFDPRLRAPYIMQASIGVERQLPANTTLAVTYTKSRGLHLLRSRALPAGDAGAIAYFYESTGRLNQDQMFINVNSRFSRRVSIFSYYVLNKAKSDTDGAGSFPADPWNLRTEYGRANNDQRHFFVLGSALTAPWGVRLSPFVIARSGGPFNITTGRDLNDDTIFNDRPAFADPGDPGAIVTQWGVFAPRSSSGLAMIPRNYGEGPGLFNVNLRVSKTFGFGERAGRASFETGDSGGGMRRGGMRGGRGGGMRMGRGGMHGDDGAASGRYNLTVGLSVRNLLNTVNPAAPIGNLLSPRFGQSIALAGFGPGGSSANNRRIEAQLRFSF